MSALRVAFIGCGAVVERSHLPTLLRFSDIVPTVLVDFSEHQRRKLADEYSIDIHGDSIDEYYEYFDVAVIATPSASHYSLAKTLLEHGKHVLVEKPLALECQQAEELVALANQAKRVLSVGLVRRYSPHFMLFKSLMDAQIVGDIDVFNVEEGGTFNWPVQGAGFFDHQVSGGGVLMDHGAHLLDACLWWFGDYETFEYSDDAHGGVEAECNITLKMQNGAQGSISMSRLRGLKNSVYVKGEKGEITMNLANGHIDLLLNNCSDALSGEAVSDDRIAPTTTLDLFEHQYKLLQAQIISADGDNVIVPGSDLVSGQDCLPSIRLIEACYENRNELSDQVK